MIKRILVASKFGPAGIFALKKSLELARQHDAELLIFHALDYLLQETDENDPKLIEKKEETKRRYQVEIEPLLGDFKNITYKCLPADPALATCKLARDFKADLIVLGCHSHKEKMCMGRIDYVGMTILEKTPCPAMLVPFCD